MKCNLVVRGTDKVLFVNAEMAEGMALEDIIRVLYSGGVNVIPLEDEPKNKGGRPPKNKETDTD